MCRRGCHALLGVLVNFLFARPSLQVLRAVTMVERFTARMHVSGEKITFLSFAQNPDNRFRYPPVSLSRSMCWWLWLGRGVPEQLFETRFGRSKVRYEIRNFENFIKYLR